MLLVAYITPLFLFFRQTEAAVTRLIKTPSDPSPAIETHDLTLVWSYTLDGTVALGRLLNITSGAGSENIARRIGDGNTTVEPKYQDRFTAHISNTQAWLKIKRVQRSDEGKYAFDLNPTGTGNIRHELEVIVQALAKFTNVSSDAILLEGRDLQLFCEASGRPLPNITWVKTFPSGHENDVLRRGLSWDFKKITRHEAGIYRCTANNGVGNPVNHSIKVTVEFLPETKLQAKYFIEREKRMSLLCQVEGYPTPAITWTPCKPEGNVCDKSRLNISNVKKDDVYTCTAQNRLGRNSSSTNVVIGAKIINLTLDITSEKCNEGDTPFWSKLKEPVTLLFKDKNGFTDVTLRGHRCGSLIVDLALKFTKIVSETWVLDTLRNATKNNKLGELLVNSSSIAGIVRIEGNVVIETTATPPTGKTTSDDTNNKVTVIVGIVVPIACAIVGIGLFIIWKKKKKKDEKDVIKGTAKGRRLYATTNDIKGDRNAAVQMENRQPEQIQQTSEASSIPQYMPLVKARQSSHCPEAKPTSITSQYASLNPSTRSYEIRRENVIIEKVIGKGAFGQVAKGKVKGLHGKPHVTQVAIKMLKADAPESDRKDLLSELKVMKTLKPHPHVIKLLGCVIESEPLLVLIDYVPYGDLLGYLRKSRGLNDTFYKDPDIKPRTSLTSQQLMKFAWQIADGMSYLSSRFIIHRDLAARNVLVGEKETCKVTDFGMARDVEQENIYEKKTKGRLPVKWTAYEALLYGIYTTKSDVWSYGVLLYEIFTIGGSPYPRMDGRKVANLLQEGYRMPKPQHVNDELYKIMTVCWQENPDARPSFSELRNRLKTMQNQHKWLINMNVYDKQLYENVEDLIV